MPSPEVPTAREVAGAVWFQDNAPTVDVLRAYARSIVSAALEVRLEPGDLGPELRVRQRREFLRLRGRRRAGPTWGVMAEIRERLAALREPGEGETRPDPDEDNPDDMDERGPSPRAAGSTCRDDGGGVAETCPVCGSEDRAKRGGVADATRMGVIVCRHPFHAPAEREAEPCPDCAETEE